MHPKLMLKDKFPCMIECDCINFTYFYSANNGFINILS